MSIFLTDTIPRQELLNKEPCTTPTVRPEERLTLIVCKPTLGVLQIFYSRITSFCVLFRFSCTKILCLTKRSGIEVSSGTAASGIAASILLILFKHSIFVQENLKST